MLRPPEHCKEQLRDLQQKARSLWETYVSAANEATTSAVYGRENTASHPTSLSSNAKKLHQQFHTVSSAVRFKRRKLRKKKPGTAAARDSLTVSPATTPDSSQCPSPKGLAGTPIELSDAESTRSSTSALSQEVRFAIARQRLVSFDADDVKWSVNRAKSFVTKKQHRMHAARQSRMVASQREQLKHGARLIDLAGQAKNSYLEEDSDEFEDDYRRDGQSLHWSEESKIEFVTVLNEMVLTDGKKLCGAMILLRYFKLVFLDLVTTALPNFKRSQ